MVEFFLYYLSLIPLGVGTSIILHFRCYSGINKEFLKRIERYMTQDKEKKDNLLVRFLAWVSKGCGTAVKNGDLCLT